MAQVKAKTSEQMNLAILQMVKHGKTLMRNMVGLQMMQGT